MSDTSTLMSDDTIIQTITETDTVILIESDPTNTSTITVNENSSNVDILANDSNNKENEQDNQTTTDTTVNTENTTDSVSNVDNVTNNVDNAAKNTRPKKIKTRGLSGITNFGSTCYMNAALQSLSVTKPFIAYMIHPESELLKHIEKRIIDEQYKKFEKEAAEKGTGPVMDISLVQVNEEAVEKLAYKLRLMMKRLWAHNCEVQPKQLKKYIDKNIKFFTGGFVQHDSQEFLSAVIDNIHETTKASCTLDVTFEGDAQLLHDEFLVLESAFTVARADKQVDTMKSIMDKMNDLYVNNKELYFHIYAKRTWAQLLKDSYSVINDIFSGMTATTIECNTCHKFYHKFERFDLLTLHLPETVEENKTQYSLHDLFNLYTQKEVLKDGNKYNCTYCGEKKEATKQQTFYQQPNTLVLLIKKYQKYNGTIFKSNIKIDYQKVT